MSCRKHGPGVLGLLVTAMLGLMGLMASGAQANWLYLEGGVAHELAANETVAVSAHTDFTLLVPSKKSSKSYVKQWHRIRMTR